MVHGVASIPMAGSALAVNRSPSAGSKRLVTLRRFIVGPENHLAVAAFQGLLNDPHCRYSPLVLYGPAGVGKSHLCHGIARAWRRKHGSASTRITTCDQFAHQFRTAVQTDAIAAFRTRYRSASLLAFEQFDALPRTPRDVHHELLQTLDALDSHRGTVVITSRLAIDAIHGISPQLINRLRAGLTLFLAPPTSVARFEILRQATRQMKLSISDQRLRLLADTSATTVPELLENLTQLAPDAPTSKLSPARTPPPIAPNAPAPLDPSITPFILTVTARHFQLKPAQLRSNSRRHTTAQARRTAIYLVRHLTGQSYQAIGRFFGNRDHTTILYNCRKAERLLHTDADTRLTIDQLTQSIVHAKHQP